VVSVQSKPRSMAAVMQHEFTLLTA
jgi:hypothetical protein